jgi:hypothetical protein
MELPSFHLVVAKYTEDVSWTSHFDSKNVYIYDKSSTPIPGSTPLENLGRETQTYLYHIIKHYDNLPDYLVIVQGYPFAHFLETLEETFAPKLYSLLSSRPELTEPLFIDFHIEDVHRYCGLLIPEYYDYLFKTPCPQKIGFAAGCQYIIPKSDILTKSLQFYKNLHKLTLQAVITESSDAHGTSRVFDKNIMSAWTAERLMYTILRESNYNPEFNKEL